MHYNVLCHTFKIPFYTDDVMRDCVDWQQSGMTTNGIYSITPIGFKPFDVYCDMTTDGGGWLVSSYKCIISVDEYRIGF